MLDPAIQATCPGGAVTSRKPMGLARSTDAIEEWVPSRGVEHADQPGIGQVREHPSPPMAMSTPARTSTRNQAEPARPERLGVPAVKQWDHAPHPNSEP